MFVNGVLLKEREIENLSNEYSFADFDGLFSNEYILFEIEFQESINKAKTSAYQWIDDFGFYVAGPLVTKLIKLDSGICVQANRINGFWEVHPIKRNTLLWKINPEKSRVIAQYIGSKKSKYFQSYPEDISKKEFKLFFTKNPLEWSRSKIPFSAVVCFTDHCDFDSKENLELQRKLFLEAGIKVTKGIFLNHFSKRTYNASFENDHEELNRWIADGHELAYHSLSQSIKTEDVSFEDFKKFNSPVPNMSTWIDHGFQPYNLSLLQHNKIQEGTFFSNLFSKGISIYWNYVDSGTSTTGVLNQLNPSHFTLRSYFKGLKEGRLRTKWLWG